MITEQALTELLGAAADEIHVPAGASGRAVERVRDDVATVPDLPRRWSRRVVIRVAAAAAVVVVAVAGVGAVIGTSNSERSTATSSTAGSSSSAAAGQAMAGSAAPVAPEKGAAGGTTSSTGQGTPGTADGGQDRRIVKNASISLSVSDGKVGDTLERLRTLAAGYGGFVQASGSNLSGSSPNGTVTLRVPVAQYAAAREALTAGTYGKATSISESGSDVTAQYADLGARLTALQTSRQTYLTMLSNAKTVGDTLAVQQKLDDVQQQIEQLQAQQKLLADSSDEATFKVTVSEAGAASGQPQPRTGFSKAAHDAWDNFTGGLQWLVSISGGLLIALILVAIFGLAGRIALRRIRRPIV